MSLFRLLRRGESQEEPVTEAANPPEDSPEEAEAPPSRRFRLRFWRRRIEPAASDEMEPLGSVRRTRAFPWLRRRSDWPSESPDEEKKPRRRLRFPWRFRLGVLLFALAMFGAAAGGVLLNLEVVPGAVGDLWPLGLVALGVVLLLGALLRHDAGRLLGAFSLAAAGVSLLLAEVELLPVEVTLAAALLMALGSTVMVRAVLWHGAE
jgi:hypothetical protein